MLCNQARSLMTFSFTLTPDRGTDSRELKLEVRLAHLHSHLYARCAALPRCIFRDGGHDTFHIHVADNSQDGQRQYVFILYCSNLYRVLKKKRLEL